METVQEEPDSPQSSLDYDTETMPTARSNSNNSSSMLRRRPHQQTARSFDSSEDDGDRPKERRTRKQRSRGNVLAYRWKAVKLVKWVGSTRLFNAGILVVVISSFAVLLWDAPGRLRTAKQVSFPKRLVAPTSNFHAPDNTFKSRVPSFGDIVVDKLDKEREIKVFPKERKEHRHRINRVFADWDDSHGLRANKECEPVDWRTQFYPNCNTFHELDEASAASSGKGKHLKFLGSGHYRSAWLINQDVSADKVVLKQLKMPEDEADYDHIVNSRSLEKVQKDAIIMERLTASSYIVDAYGLCGTSIFAENMPNEVAELIIPGSGHAKQNELDRLPELVPGNKYSVEEKLDMAIDMAQALADIHGFPGGVIVHGDVHPVQWLQSPEGKLKLNDFNNAEILDWNKNKMRSCKTNRGSWGGNYRSPEEYRGDGIDEKIDVYSMGNNLYTLLTGYWPFYEEHRYSPVIQKVKKRERPFVDDRWKKKSYTESKFAELMDQMWKHTPEERPDIFTVLQILRDVKKHEEKHKKKHAAHTGSKHKTKSAHKRSLRRRDE